MFTVKSQVSPDVRPSLDVESGIEVALVRVAANSARAAERVWLDAKVVAWFDALQTLDGSGHRHTREAMDPLQRRPEAVLVETSQPPLEIDAPGLLRRRTELQRAEWNAQFRVPPVFADARAHVPDAIPVAVVLAAFVRHLGVELRPAGFTAN